MSVYSREFTILLYYFQIEIFYFNLKDTPNGVVDSMIFGIENHRISSHYDLPIKNLKPTA